MKGIDAEKLVQTVYLPLIGLGRLFFLFLRSIMKSIFGSKLRATKIKLFLRKSFKSCLILLISSKLAFHCSLKLHILDFVKMHGCHGNL